MNILMSNETLREAQCKCCPYHGHHNQHDDTLPDLLTVYKLATALMSSERFNVDRVKFQRWQSMANEAAVAIQRFI